jgi:hypothetical protein
MMRTPIAASNRWTGCLLVVVAMLASVRVGAQEPGRIIEILADRDSRYKIAGQPHPAITMKAGERIVLRITARKAHGANRDGSIHGFALTRARDGARVPGWDLLLKPGTQDFDLVAPQQPGEYLVVCTVICSQDHDGMHMKILVTE